MSPLRSWLAIAALCALAGLGIYLQRPPRALPATAPAFQFSSARALAHIRAVAAGPHEAGSEANRAARDYILGQLRSFGIVAHVQRAFAAYHHHGSVLSTGEVENIVARLPGTAPGKALMLAAHYDSAPNAPGAADDGNGVGVILETLRALRARPPLRNDVVALFSDGEEGMLLGAEAFTSLHPWARDVAVVLNFEARGTTGPGLMFETNAANGWVIRNFAQAAPSPVSSSLYYDFYKRMPNDTDFTVFKRAGMAGLNFSFTGGALFYHTPQDDAAHLDPRSVQHQGTYALSLARQFGNRPLDNAREPDRVYFNLPFLGLVHYPQSLAIPLALAALAGLASSMRSIRPAGAAVGAGGLLAALAASALSAMGIWRVIRIVHASRFAWRFGAPVEPYRPWPYELGFALISVAVAVAIYAAVLRRWKPLEAAAGALAIWCAGALASAFLMPGASYLFVWPLFAGAAGLASKRPAALLPAAALAALLWVPLLTMLSGGLGLSQSWIGAAGLALVLSLLLPLVQVPRWTVAAVCAVAAIAAFASAGIGPAFDANHPRADSLYYFLDADTGTAVWASPDPKPDEWTSQYLTATPKRGPLPGGYAGSFPHLMHEAPAIGAEPVALDILSDTPAGDRRELTLRCTRNAPGAASVQLRTGPGVKLSAIGGRHFSPAAAASRISIDALPAEGLELALEVPPSFELTAITTLPGLPESRPRPAGIMTQPVFGSDSTVIAKHYKF